MATDSTAVYTFLNFIRGYHVYKDTWTPKVNETLDIKHEPGNICDKHAMAVLKNGTIIGHAPQEYSRVMHFFITRGGTITATVTGEKLNRGQGLGLEVPALYTFRGNEKDTNTLKNLLMKA